MLFSSSDHPLRTCVSLFFSGLFWLLSVLVTVDANATDVNVANTTVAATKTAANVRVVWVVLFIVSPDLLLVVYMHWIRLIQLLDSFR